MSQPFTKLIAEMREQATGLGKLCDLGDVRSCVAQEILTECAERWEAALAEARELCYDKDTLSKLVSIEWVLRDIIGEQKKGIIEQARNPTG